MVKKHFIAFVFTLIIMIAVKAQGGSWYKSYTGTIGKYPATMHLHKSGDTYSGYYYYQSSQQPIYMLQMANEDAKPGVIHFINFVPGDNGNDERFELTISNTSCKGVWKIDDKKLVLPVIFTEKQIAQPSFDFIYAEGTQVLKPGMEESPTAEYKAASVWPRGSSVLVDSIKTKINEIFGEKASRQDIGKTFLANKKYFFDEYRKENGSVSDSEIVEFGQSYNMQEDQELLVQFHSSRLLSLAFRYYIYSGGAHGNRYTQFINFNLSNGKTLTSDDVLTADGLRRMPALLEKYFRKDRKLSATADLVEEGGLNDSKIEPNGNIFLTDKGIGFSYPPYEIASYAMGEITIFIPFSELANYLKPGFKKLIL